MVSPILFLPVCYALVGRLFLVGFFIGLYSLSTIFAFFCCAFFVEKDRNEHHTCTYSIYLFLKLFGIKALMSDKTHS